MMLIWEGNNYGRKGVHIIQLVRGWDKMHLVVVVD